VSNYDVQNCKNQNTTQKLDTSRVQRIHVNALGKKETMKNKMIEGTKRKYDAIESTVRIPSGILEHIYMFLNRNLDVFSPQNTLYPLELYVPNMVVMVDLATRFHQQSNLLIEVLLLRSVKGIASVLIEFQKLWFL